MRWIGVTTWIKGHVLRGVPFARRTTSGQRARKNQGQHLGRLVDGAFKTYCKTGAVGRGQHQAVSRANFAVRALRQAGLTLIDANVFVKLGGIKTHLDGVATDSAGRKVVVELKSTQSTAADHVAVYDVPCTAQPLTAYGPNTERLHHRLQTVFGARAAGAHRGVTVVACADRAIVYDVADTFPEGVFGDCRLRDLAAGAPAPVPRWTAAARRGLPPVFTVAKVMHKQVAILKPAGCAVIVPAPPSSSPRGVVAAAKGLLAAHEAPRYLVWPKNGTWRAVAV